MYEVFNIALKYNRTYRLDVKEILLGFFNFAPYCFY